MKRNEQSIRRIAVICLGLAALGGCAVAPYEPGYGYYGYPGYPYGYADRSYAPVVPVPVPVPFFVPRHHGHHGHHWGHHRR